MGDARTDGGKAGRQAADHSRSAGRARAEIGAARRDDDLRLRQGAVRQTSRRQGEFQQGLQAAGRGRYRRTRRASWLLRDGVDDAQHVRGAAARRHESAVQRAGEVANYATRPTGLPPACIASLGEAPRGRLMRWRSNSRKRSFGIGGETSAPWPKSQPITISACKSACDSTPSATAALPKRCARSIAVWQIAALVASVAQPWTKDRSSFSSANGSWRRLENDE